MHGDEHRETRQASRQPANVLVQQEKHGDAEALVRAELEAGREKEGSRHPSTLSALSTMREVLVEQGKLTEAEPLMREELLASREARGARHARKRTWRRRSRRAGRCLSSGRSPRRWRLSTAITA